MGRTGDLFIVILILALSGMAQAGGGSEVALFPVKEGGKWGYINREGKAVINLKYSAAGDFSEGLAYAVIGSCCGSKWGFINGKGEFINQGWYVWANPFSEGLASVKTPENKWGFIDKGAGFVIPPAFNRVGPFSEGLAGVDVSEDPLIRCWGYIDRTGKMVVKPKFDAAGAFAAGLAPGEEGCQVGLYRPLRENGDWLQVRGGRGVFRGTGQGDVWRSIRLHQQVR